MRKSSIVAAVTAALSIITPASAAPIRTLHARSVADQASWVGQFDATHAAYRSTPGDTGVVVIADDGATRRVEAPAGCAISGAGTGLLAGSCDEDPRPVTYTDGSEGIRRQLVVLRADGSVVTRLYVVGRINGQGLFPAGSPKAVGAQWIRSDAGCFHCGEWWEDINWHTGEVRQSGDDDPRKRSNLDAPPLDVPLCAPLRRSSAPEQEYEPALLPVTVRGPWALIEGLRGRTLRHCGLARPVKLPSGFRPEALGDGWVAGTVAVAHRSPRVELVRLSDRRRFVVAGIPGDQAKRGASDFAFTRGRFYVHGDNGSSGLRPLLSVALPRR
jgi:hypothetical protein